MRWLGSMGIVLLLAGCAQEPVSETPDHDESADQDAISVPSSGVTTNATRPSNAAGNGTGNSSGNQTLIVPGNQTGNLTGNQTENATAPPVVVVHEETFSGTVPVDGLQPEHPFQVPEGAVRVEVTYTSVNTSDCSPPWQPFRIPAANASIRAMPAGLAARAWQPTLV